VSRRQACLGRRPAPQHATEPTISAVYFVVEPNRDQLADLAELADHGQLRPTIDQVFPLADARKAFARSLRHNRRGKIVLRVADET
jgi:NADPH:quinone reductase-like Zn-dependent oxidoreductase